jgi:hypothetical protein
MTIPRKTVAQSDEVDDTDKSCQIASWHWKILPERELAMFGLGKCSEMFKIHWSRDGESRPYYGLVKHSVSTNRLKFLHS